MGTYAHVPRRSCRYYPHKSRKFRPAERTIGRTSRTSSTHGAIVVAGHPNGLAVVRALGEQGIPVVVITSASNNIAQYSRYCLEHHACHTLSRSRESLVELLLAHKRRWKGWCIFPTNDHAIEAIATHHDCLASHYTLTTMPWEVSGKLLDKAAQAKLAEEVGVDRPVDYGPATLEMANRTDIQFPVIIKPVKTHLFRLKFGCKLFAAHDTPEFQQRLKQVVDSALEAHVMELIQGSDDAIYNYLIYMDEHHEPAGGMVLHKLRQSPPLYGVSRVAETGGFESLRHPTVEMLRRLRFHGMAASEFKLDRRTGQLKFIEINGRHHLNAGLARRAGIDLPQMAWRDVMLHQSPVAVPNGWQGTWIHLRAEAECLLRHRHLEHWSAAQYLAPYLRPKTFAVWDRRDPRPFYMQWRHAADAALRKMTGRGHNEEDQ